MLTRGLLTPWRAPEGGWIKAESCVLPALEARFASVPVANIRCASGANAFCLHLSALTSRALSRLPVEDASVSSNTSPEKVVEIGQSVGEYGVEVQRMSDDDDLESIGLRLHARLLEGTDRAADEIILHYRPHLIAAISRGFPRLSDPHLVETAANDALLAYLGRPEKFDPARSSLIAYLYMHARSNLIDLFRQQTRIKKNHSEFEDGLTSSDSSIDPERRLIESDSALIRHVRKIVTDPRDREVLSLMAEGERETAVFAEALGLEHLTVVEQAIAVKRHKDRLKKALTRGLARKRLAIIAAIFVGLQRRIRAAARLQVAAIVIALLALIGSQFLALRSVKEARATDDDQSTAAMQSVDQGPANQAALVAGEYVEKIFFVSERAAEPGTNQQHIWMMNLDGSQMEQVTFGDVQDDSPDISPDGTKLVYSRNASPQQFDADNHPGILVKDLSSGVEIPVTVGSDYPWGVYVSFGPTWSPDGTKIAFQRTDIVNFGPEQWMIGIWIVDFAPSIGEPKQITPLTGYSRQSPSWSPDGHIFYSKQVSRDGPAEIWKIDPETMEEGVVIPLAVHESVPVVSPDGSRLLWLSDRNGEQGGDIYIADAANPMNSQLRVTPYSGFGVARWSPDGKSMVAVSVMYRLTDHSLKRLAHFGVPADVVTRLKCAKTRKAMKQPEMLDLVRSCVGDELTEKHRYRIIQQTASERNLSVMNADGTGIRQLTSGMNMLNGGRWVRIRKEAAAAIKERQKVKGKSKDRVETHRIRLQPRH